MLVLFLSLGMTYALWQDARHSAVKELQVEFAHRTLEAAEQVRQRMLNYDQMLRGLRGLFNASVHVDRNEFREYCATLNLAERLKGVQALAFIRRVEDSEKTRHIADVRNEGFPEYRIWPDAKRAYYTPVVYLEPSSERNMHTLGFDVSSEPVRRVAMERARDTDSAVITGKIELLPGPDQKPTTGFLMLLPIYQNGSVHNTVAERRSQIRGWVGAVFSAEELMTGILGQDEKEIDIEIFDGDSLAERYLLYDDDKLLRATPHSTQLFQNVQKLEIAGRVWTLRVSSLPEFEKRLNSSKAQSFAMGGLIVSLLLALMTWILVRSRVRSIQAANLLGQELSAREQAE